MHAMAICIICTVTYFNELAYNVSTIYMQFQPLIEVYGIITSN